MNVFVQSKQIANKLFPFFAVIFFAIFYVQADVKAQTTVYTNDFTGAGTVIPGGVPAAVFTNLLGSATRSGVQVGGTDPATFSTAFTANQLAEWVAGPAAAPLFSTSTTNSFSQTTAPLAGYLAPFNATLSSNSGLVTWTFNMNTGIAATGFANTQDNAVVVLVGTNASVGTAGNGYAVTFNPASNKNIELVRYTGGVQGTVTTIISSGVSLTTATDYASVRVTYDPATNTWNLYVRDDGAAAFANPAVGVAALGGTAVDATYTGVAMSVFGFFSNHEAQTVNILISLSFDNYSYFDNYTVVVNCTVAPITGTGVVCSGSTLPLSDITVGGAWSSATPGVATVAGTGVVTGMAAGTAMISYTIGTCFATTIVTVVAAPSAILGTLSVCEGATTSLSDALGGGAWTSSTPGVATIDPVTGLVTGILAGTSTINYATSAGLCNITAVVTVNASPSAILGAMAVCTGLTTALTDAVAGGTWSSEFPAIASVVTGTGVVSGVTGGTSHITYTMPGNCFVTTIVTVNTSPSAILGTLSVCEGGITSLSDVLGGGVWTSSSPGNAVIDPVTGSVTGILAGTTTINYATSGGLCNVTAVVTVNASPTIILGTATVCTGLTTTLSDGVIGGTWSSEFPAIATVVSGTGVVTGVTGGTSHITYTMPGNCVITTIVTVNPSPSAILGTLSVCQGSTTALSDLLAGGVWTSASPGIATIDPVTGLVTGVLGGTSVINYATSGGLCNVTATVTVNTSPTTILGTMTVCTGLTTALTDAVPGGTWSSEFPAIASVVTATGVVSGITAGTSHITYTMPGNCFITTIVTVNASPSAILGTLSVCQGSTTSLSDILPGGAWTSASPGIATIDPVTGLVTGILGGTSTINYATSGGLCNVTAVVTVNTSPTAILGTPNVCVGLTTTLSDAVAGGTWSVDLPGIASVVTGTGVVTGVAAGTNHITYTMPGNCFVTTIVTVNPAPSAILGNPIVCQGSTTSLSNTVGGGAWSSLSPAIASIDPVTGLVTGLLSGTSTIVYTSTNCTPVTVVVTVNPVAAISGTPVVCTGLTITLTDAVAGGTWTSGSPAIATIGLGTGLVSGLVAGTSLVVYTTPANCTSSVIVTVNQSPTAINGTLVACEGLSVTLTDGLVGGTWATSNANTTVGSSTGVVTAVAFGTSTITYTLPDACFSTATFTVNPGPAVITGLASGCTGLSINLSDATPGGSWSSGNPVVATVGSSTGVVAGLTVGTSIISYILPTGCISTIVVTVNASPLAIVGSTTVCVGSTTTLTDPAIGGTWASSTPANATIGLVSGIVSGLVPGTTTITYTLPIGGCTATMDMTINPLPLSITGPGAVCEGSAIALTDATAGGTWSSGSPGIATVGSATGTVTGVLAGVATISYMLPTGCYVTASVIVNTTPTGILGSSTVCEGATTTLSDAIAGGAWNSSSPGTAFIGGASGIVSGLVAGTTTITYTLPAGSCFNTMTMTVNPLPLGIAGPGAVCAGLSITLTDATAGGTWSSASPGTATVGSATGIVTGVLAGAATISYILPTGCYVTTSIIVNPSPVAISGSTTVCVGSTTTLTDGTAGGAWSSSTPANATIGAGTGLVSGLIAGTTTIIYTLPAGGCNASMVMTVNPLPLGISSPGSVCQGLSITLTDATAGGTWSSGSPAVATVGSATGVVTGVLAGTATISYILPTGCYATTPVTVNPAPSGVSGSNTVCEGATITLTDPIAGGVWSSTIPANATVGAGTGVVSGILAGTTTIIYTLPAGGCNANMTITVNPLPLSINGPASVCGGLSITLTDATAGGAWSSASPATAAVGSGTGIVTGGISGVTTISYMLPTGCYVTAPMTVNPSPAAISGSSSVCEGSLTLLTDITAGGAWSSSAPAIASVGTGTGIVSGLLGGTTTISYTLPAGGCNATMIVSVNPLPLVINGPSTICAGLFITLTDATLGGTWSSGAPGVAALSGAFSGIVSGITPGTSTITYMLSTGCYVTTPVTVNPSPAAITGSNTVCEGSSITLTDATAGGAWSSSSPLTASVGTGSGVVSGLISGTATISYVLPAGSCAATKTITVNPLPLAITGPGSVCVGSAIVLSSATTGGTWSSSNAAMATVTGTGTVNGVAVGVVTITYMLGTGCYVTAPVTVNPLPSAITGANDLCIGLTTLLSDVAIGGTWSSAAPGIAFATAGSGLITGTGAGVTTISYILPTGCFITRPITVHTPPTAISGSHVVCLSSTATLSDGTPGGTWSVGVGSGGASVGSSTGIVTGLALGTVTISYSTFSCNSVGYMVSIDPIPAPITGLGSICSGSTVSLSDVTPGGTWSTSSAVVSVSATGVVSGVAAGTGAIITYMLPTGCFVTAPISVDSIPGPILGVDSVCPGSSVFLSDVTPGGVWTSSDGTIALSIAFTGEVRGIVPGTVVISYTLVSGCYITMPFRVLTPVPSFLSITSSPPDTLLCSGTPDTLIAVPVNGGNPTYEWELFGAYLAVGDTLIYNPTHGDFITCIMTTHNICASPSVVSKDVTLNVWPNIAPIITISTPLPDTSSYLGQVYTFYTTVTYGGPTPSYQWYINNVPVAGATNTVFTTHIYNDNDTIYCKINSNSPCDTANAIQPSNAIIITGQWYLSVNGLSVVGNDLTLFPNPNTGSFSLTGTLGAMDNQEVIVEVTDVLGRVLFSDKTQTKNGELRDDIKLGNDIAPGNYLLRVHTETRNETFHFVISK